MQDVVICIIQSLISIFTGRIAYDRYAIMYRLKSIQIFMSCQLFLLRFNRSFIGMQKDNATAV